MLITPSHLLVLNIFGNSFQQDLLQHHLPREQGEADWPVVPQILHLVLLEDRRHIPVLRNLHHELSKIIQSASQ